MNSTQTAILDSLNCLNLKYNKGYCFPTQVKLLELLKTYHNKCITRRALNYALASMVRQGMIVRFRRHEKKSDGQLYLRSTAYYIAKKARKFGVYLVGLGRRAALGFAVKKIAHNSDDTKNHISAEKVCPVDNWGATPLSELMSSLKVPWRSG